MIGRITGLPFSLIQASRTRAGGFPSIRTARMWQLGMLGLPQCQRSALLVAGLLGLSASVLVASIVLLGESIDTVSAQQQSTGQDLTLHSDNGAPRGIWSDRSIIWVADSSDTKLYAYSLADASRLEDRDIDLGGFSFNPLGLWSDHTTIWVLNAVDDKIYGYTLADGNRDETKDISLDGENDIPMDIWSDGTTMYVVDQSDKKLYAYALNGGTRQSDKDIAISSDRPRPVGVWSDSSTFWISYDHHSAYSDDDDYRLYAFRLEDGAREEESDVQIATDPNSRSLAIWSDGATIWVTDKFYRKIFAYPLPRPTPSSDATLQGLSISAGTLTPAFASSTLSYVASVGYETTLLTVNATTSDSSASMVVLNDNDIELPDIDDMDHGHQVQLAVNENVLKVQVTAEDETTVQTYLVTVTRERPNVSVNSRQEEVTEGDTAELVVLRGIAVPEQLDVQLSVSETESLLTSSEKGVRAVTIPLGATSTVLSLATDTDDDEWEVHSTVTVAIDKNDGYLVNDSASSTSFLVLDDDFPAATATLSVSPNPVPEGATTTAIITVTTQADRQPHGSGGPLVLRAIADTAQASDLTALNQTSFELSPDDFSTTTVDSGTRYRAHYTAAIATVDDNIVEVGEAFEIELSKATSTRGSLILSKPSMIAVSIIDNDAALSSLALGGLTLSPSFASHIHQYEAQADYSVEQTEIAASAGHPDSSAPTILLAGVVDADGIVPLEVGENEISVEVVAEDASLTATYVINVTRANPKISIGSVAADVNEGQTVEFLISRHAAASEPLDVEVEVTESGSHVPAGSLGTRTVTIPGATTTATTTVSTHSDDDLWEPHSVVTATIKSADTIEIEVGAGEASTRVRDNDFPDASAAIVVAPNPVSEGATVLASLIITTKRGEEPHGPGGNLTIAAREDTAEPADFGRFGQTTFTVDRDDFSLLDLSGVQRYQATYTAAIAITDDSDSEPDESFHILVSKTSAPRIELPNPATTTVVIAANDSSTDPTLSQLTLSAGTLSPPFSSTTTRYSADLGYGIERVTISPIVNSDNSDLAFLDGSNIDLLDASSSEDGHQVELEVGANTVNIRVTAEDKVTIKTYTVVLTRQKPEVSLFSNAAEVPEGTELDFNLVRNARVSDVLKVRVEIDESGAMVADIEEGVRTATIPSNATSTSIKVSTEHDDRDWEPHSTVRASISASSTYAIRTDAERARTTVRDDDFPEASATLALNPARVPEGDSSTILITVTTARDQEPHGSGGTLTLTPVGGTAIDDDYRSLSQSTYSIEASDFERVDNGNGSAVYRAVYSATVETIDDSESEPDETIVFQLGKGADSQKISIEGPATTTVTIIANDASSDAALSGMTLNGSTLSPPFTASTTSYIASVSYGVEQATLEYTKSDSGADVSVLGPDNKVLDDANTAPGFQVNLAVGSNVVTLRVTAEDESAMQSYVVTITRSKPTVGIRRVANSVPEGGVIELTVSRDESATEALGVLVEVAETAMLLAAGEIGQSTITIPTGATSTTFNISADIDDNVWEEHSTVTARIVASSTYDIAGGLGSAKVQIEDSDFPEATAELELSHNPIVEGEQLTARVTVTTNADQQPHGDGGTLILRVTGDTAQANDFELPHEVEFDIASMDFVPVLVSGTARYRASYSATTTIVDDDEAEPSEILIVAISKKGSPGISLPTPSTSTVTIAPSDLSMDASLSSLTIGEGTLIPEFSSTSTDYMVRVEYGVERVAITPTASDSDAVISINATPINSSEGYLADLPVGTTTIEVIVTAQDTVTTITYSLVVIRARPEVGISPVLPQVSEGEDVSFRVSRDVAVSDRLELLIDIVESGDLVRMMLRAESL